MIRKESAKRMDGNKFSYEWKEKKWGQVYFVDIIIIIVV
jgi:hypothetical protein